MLATWAHVRHLLIAACLSLAACGSEDPADGPDDPLGTGGSGGTGGFGGGSTGSSAGGFGGGSGAGGGSAAGSGGAGGGSSGAICSKCATDLSLPDITLCVSSSKCVYQVGESGKFDVSYEVGPAPPGTLHVPATASCDCGSNVSYFVGAGAIMYCICDQGCCAPQPSYELTPAPSTTTNWSFDWPGLQWMGPSDTNEPYGPPFPPGDYFATVTYAYEEGSVTVQLPIHVVQ